LLLDFEAELVLASKVAVLQAAGYRRSEIARMLTTETPAALRVAELRVKRASERLDQGND
jgi:transcriptional regulator